MPVKAPKETARETSEIQPLHKADEEFAGPRAEKAPPRGFHGMSLSAMGSELSPRDVQMLQRAVGNRRVQRMLGRAAAGDSRGRSSVTRQAEGTVGGTIAPETEHRLDRTKGDGDNIPPDVRAPMERRLNADFSEVRLHNDADAHNLARDMGARAFTSGQDVYFAEGQYKPGTAEGERLLAHELVHTIQQRGRTAGPQRATRVSHPSDASEREAERVATRAVPGNSSVATIARQAEDEPVGTVAEEETVARQAEDERVGTVAEEETVARQAEDEPVGTVAEEETVARQAVEEEEGPIGATGVGRQEEGVDRETEESGAMAHEVQRAAATAEPPPAEDVAPGVYDLKGAAEPEFKPPASVTEWFGDRRRGNVKLRFGQLTEERTVKFSRDKKGRFKLRKKAALPLKHPLFSRVAEVAPSLQPSLIILEGRRVSGFIGLRASAPSGKSLVGDLLRNPDAIGLAGLRLGKFKLPNKIERGSLLLGPVEIPIKLGKTLDGSITVETKDQNINKFAGEATTDIKGLATGKVSFARSPEGVVTGKGSAELKLPKNFTGSVAIAWDGQSVSGEGKVGYSGEKMSGEVTLRVMEKEKADQLEKDRKAPPAPEGTPASPKPNKAKAKLKPSAGYVVFGEGDLTFSFTEWLTGTAHVIVDPKGYVTIIGKITPQKEFELFEQKDYNKRLFKIEPRATYGIPVVGNIFIFANLSMDAFATIGPAKFYKIEVAGTYSTDPKKAQDFSIRGSLNISAAAGLKLRGEAGAGLEILSHDIKAGAGINAIAAVRGYAEATPIIGYREKAAKEGEDKKGEFYIRGEIEIAAQPFLGLGGDLFVEIDAPWWSPVPDKKWTWPLGSKEYPLGGSLGVNASVDYVFGSGVPPKLEFKPVEFSGDKFLSDLYADKAQSKSGAAGAKKGKWDEKNTKEAEPPSKEGPKGGAPVGKLKSAPPARAKVSPGGPRRSKRPVDPNAKTAEGKSVKEYQAEAAREGKKPTAKGAEPTSAKGDARDKESGKLAHDQQLRKGLAALEAVTARYAKDGATREEVVGGVKSVRRKFKVFKSIEVIDGGDTWDYKYSASPTSPKTGVKKATGEGKTQSDPLEVKWPSVQYPNIKLIPDVRKPAKTAIARPGAETELKGLRSDLTVGVDSGYLNPKGLYRNRPERGSTKQATFRDWMERHGYHALGNPDPYEADHVVDYTFGGKDVTKNLWPLERGRHKTKTSDVWNNMKILAGPHKGRSVNQLRDKGKTYKNRWFKVK